MNRKSIIITGAASGIGRETARLFAGRAWFVGIFDINEDALVELALEIGDERCCWGVLDVCDSEQWKQAVARFGERTSGRMDVLFNSAGILKMGPFMDTPLDVHLQTLRVNVVGVLTAIRAAFPLLSSTPKSRVISRTRSVCEMAPPLGIAPSSHCLTGGPHTLCVERNCPRRELHLHCPRFEVGAAAIGLRGHCVLLIGLPLVR